MVQTICITFCYRNVIKCSNVLEILNIAFGESFMSKTRVYMVYFRIYKRYFYRNINNGKMQWEYPKSDDIVDLCKQAPPPPPPPPTCSSPSPLPPVQPSSTSPPQILGCDDNVKQRPVKKKKIEGTKGISKHLGEIEEIGVIDISESPVSEAPESQTSQTDPVFGQLGELLPPNVDLSDTQNVVEKPQEQDLSDIDGVEMGTEDEICEITNTIPENTIEPRKQDLLSPAVIAKPPAKASLHDELDSFYSDLANLEKAGVIPSATEEYLCEQDIIQQPAEQMEAIVHDKSVDSENSSKSSDMVLTEVKKKKKQPKLAPGLSLKKKGVSSLVAKWQQVQQEVRRDYKNIDSKDSGIQN